MPTVRAADRSDCAALSAIHLACFARGWSADEFNALLTAPNAVALVANDNQNRAIGFVLVRTAADEGEIISIAVLPEARRQHIGRLLLLAASDLARTKGAAALFLEVSESNEAARALYCGLGFAEVGRRPSYYRERNVQEDALVLKAPLPLTRCS